MAKPTYVDLAEAVALLGVKPATLYTYVSRGWVTRVRGARGSRYLRADLLRLKARHDARAGHAAAAVDALNWGQPVIDSAITAVSEGRLYYHGHDALGLAAAGVRYEQVAELLFTGILPARRPELAGAELERLARRAAARRAARGRRTGARAVDGGRAAARSQPAHHGGGRRAGAAARACVDRLARDRARAGRRPAGRPATGSGGATRRARRGQRRARRSRARSTSRWWRAPITSSIPRRSPRAWWRRQATTCTRASRRGCAAHVRAAARRRDAARGGTARRGARPRHPSSWSARARRATRASRASVTRSIPTAIRGRGRCCRSHARSARARRAPPPCSRSSAPRSDAGVPPPNVDFGMVALSEALGLPRARACSCSRSAGSQAGSRTCANSAPRAGRCVRVPATSASCGRSAHDFRALRLWGAMG